MSPQYCVAPTVQVVVQMRPPSVEGGSGIDWIAASDRDDPASFAPDPAGPSVNTLTLLSTLQATVHARPQTSHPRTESFALTAHLRPQSTDRYVTPHYMCPRHFCLPKRTPRGCDHARMNAQPCASDARTNMLRENDRATEALYGM